VGAFTLENACIRLICSLRTRRCTKLNRQLFSASVVWLHKRRGENGKNRKAGLGRVLFTSSPFREFSSGEIKRFDGQVLLTCPAAFRPNRVRFHHLFNKVVPPQ
jgi:hypothetical protein